METVSLGRSGLRVSRLCLGTMLFGSQCDERTAFGILDEAEGLGIDYGRMYQQRYRSERMFDVVEAVEAVARDEGLSPTQVALLWLLAQDGMTAPIVGASRPEQLHDAAAAVGHRLSEASRTRLDEVSWVFV